jgi:hypothetical protein
VGALFRVVRHIHINHVCENVCLGFRVYGHVNQKGTWKRKLKSSEDSGELGADEDSYAGLMNG